jgi:hypothetical protein
MNNAVTRPDSTPKNPPPPPKSQPGHIKPIGPAYPVHPSKQASDTGKKTK